MQLRTMTDVRTKALAGDSWGGNLAADAAIAEVLRAEVTAHGRCRRAATISRVLQTLSALVEISKERVANVCETLQQQGDVSLASGGVLHATPLRAVEVETGVWHIVSSLPLRHLKKHLPGSIQSTGTRRQFVFMEADLKDALAAVEGLGGVKMAASTWAGLERAPIADASWLENLEEQLKWLPKAPGSLERDGKFDWQALRINAEGTRWRRDAEAPAKLWRARSPWGYWAWAWTGSEGSPSAEPFVSLSSDDANRTVFALARAVKQPLYVGVVHDVDASILSIRDWLPKAEYRYLSTMAQPLSRESHMNCWSLPVDKEEEVLATLAKHLGLEKRES
jgi:hypothetical protein